MRFHGSRVARLLIVVVLFFLEVDLEEGLDEDDGTDDAQHTEGIGASISVGDDRDGSSMSHLFQCRVGGTKSRCVCHGTAQHTHHHGQVVGIARVHKGVVEDEHHCDVEQDDATRQQVEGHTSLFERREEGWSDLDTYGIDEQDQTEVLHETDDRPVLFHWLDPVVLEQMPDDDSHKQHERDA